MAKQLLEADVPPFRASSLIKLLSGSLDPHKQWYLLTKEICGMRLTDFAKTEIFTKIFHDEMQWREVQPATSYSTSNARQSSVVSVISLFGLYAGLLRQKVISPYELIKSPAFEPVQRLVNTDAGRGATKKKKAIVAGKRRESQRQH